MSQRVICRDLTGIAALAWFHELVSESIMPLRPLDASQSEQLALIAKAFAPALQQNDLYDLLQYLNARTDYRFTGVYRFEPGWVISIALFDRKAPHVRVGVDVKMKESYCWLTGLGGMYEIEDASEDARLDGHAAREAVRSYVAVLLRDRAGTPWGTLCHFDFAPRNLTSDARTGLESFRPLIEEMFIRDHVGRWDPDAPSARRFQLATES
jgi:GAF domain-containing protein